MVQISDDSTAHTLCALDKRGYRNTYNMCNTYWFYTATVVTETRPNVTFIRSNPPAHLSHSLGRHET